MRILKAAVLYFAIVFGVGFALGTIRTLGLVPRLGPRAAELLEMPVMLVVIAVAARSVVRSLSVPSTKSARLAVGFVALISKVLDTADIVKACALTRQTQAHDARCDQIIRAT